MGKQGSPRSPRPDHTNFGSSDGAKDFQGRISGGENYNWNKAALFHGLKNEPAKFSSCKVGKRHQWFGKNVQSLVLTFVLMGFLFFLDSLLFSNLDSTNGSNSRKSIEAKEDRTPPVNEGKTTVQMYDRLVNLAVSALVEKEFRQHSSKFWEEQYRQSSIWRPCADRKSPNNLVKPKKSNGFILVSANGGLNQQRVAVCNAVAVASLLNATLVIPKFLYSNVWKDPSQFGDIYEEEHFLNSLKDEVNIIKELPNHLKSLHFEAIGSLVCKTCYYIRTVLPILLKNGVVHFLGFGNRLGFDPLPFELQRLRCKCNFHALKFVPKIKQVGALLIKRLRKYEAARSMLDKQLLGNYLSNSPLEENDSIGGVSKYLALHLRFEVDMVAYSQCEFGGCRPISAVELRRLGRCPLTPEEAALVLAGLGFKRGTFIYLAGSKIYGGQSRMHPLTSLYPNLVTKEELLTPRELAPFRNFSSQMAALDFIACATADVFAITDSGSQLSSLVSGFRTYYGGGRAPTLRPSKKRLAAILSENNTISWQNFEERIRKMIDEGQRVSLRGYRRSIYRQPRCPECMCKSHVE
ncbi:hypothetical protein NMG60_11015008 [Bertholletia excelsa]